MTELELKLSLPDQLADQAKAAGLLTSEAIEGLVRQAIRKSPSGASPRSASVCAKPAAPGSLRQNWNPA